MPAREFHVSRAARDRYQFDDALFGVNGNVVFADFQAARRFARKINQERDLADPASAVRAGDISAMGLVDEILHFVIDLYQRDRNPHAIAKAFKGVEEAVGEKDFETTLLAFAENFPTIQAYRGDTTAADYLTGSTNGTPNREIVVEELLLLWLANQNEAYAQLEELFDDEPLETRTAYERVIGELDEWFRSQPGFGPHDEDLLSLLRKPAIEGGADAAAQLRWITDNWGFAAERFGDRLVLNLDVLTEEERAMWMRTHATQGGSEDRTVGDLGTDAAALHGFDFGAGAPDPEFERFSHDLDWMPRVVLLAKSTYVWLDQLSRAYGRPIWRLDQIPDEELDVIASRGFTGLWLIGLWERSRASREIKQLRGNPEAVASAYSLMDYRIADDLGGEDAYANLRDRAWTRGMRLASDMVPNHMGIDSRWVVEHPDWFMQRSDPPFPDYTYHGPNLSNDERVGIYIEDHYFDNTNAAVTFRRQDRWSGQERFVYHGNDGTSMPWNDTAQLDYLKPEVREAVIQTILAVAHRFPIIRFDAAMTLAKRHIQRLWYPEPGTAGAIPSRAEFSMTKAEFDRHMPVEFWREVVDRVAAEAPDTLLLAEAFWLMEGYFVRTLGMHRVYNSAFMNMMRDEKNAEYRLVIKNTLEFDPQILKRYVNFMNNPDERTAVDQFGKGDKYFGVATVMATMPGLPMFGHGQVEGFGERYGMEYRRAYLDETPDSDLIARHEREIFPLLHRRHLFAEVEDFALYDFHTADGAVNEDVFAFSNRRDGVRSMVVYHNRFADTTGWIRTAAVTGKSLADGLSLSAGADDYLVLKDGPSDLFYIRSQSDLAEKGLYLSLGAYQYHVFAEMFDIHDKDGRYGRLSAWLEGRGVASLDDAMRDMELAPLHTALRTWLDDRRGLDSVVVEAARLAGVTLDHEPAVNPGKLSGAIDHWVATRVGEEGSDSLRTYDAWLAARVVDQLLARTRPELAGGRWLREWRVDRVLPDADLIYTMLEIGRQSPEERDGDGVSDVLPAESFRHAIGVNEHDGIEWFSKEQFERSVDWLEIARSEGIADAKAEARAKQRTSTLKRAAKTAGYRLDEFEKLVSARAKKRSRPRAASAVASPRGSSSRVTVPETKPQATTRTKPAPRE